VGNSFILFDPQFSYLYTEIISMEQIQGIGRRHPAQNRYLVIKFTFVICRALVDIRVACYTGHPMVVTVGVKHLCVYIGTSFCH
jgi:hypothetical protein